MKFRHLVVACLVLLPSGLSHAEQSTEKKAAVNFTDHVLPIFRQHCLDCHNANDAEAGLAIDSFGALMEGGGSGDVVSAGDVSASRLYQVMTHAEEPAMPPNQDPIPEESLNVIRDWIEGGLLENSGSKAKKRKGPSLTFSTNEGGKPDEIIMPESVWRVPVVTSKRAAAATALASSPWAPLVAVAGQRQVSLYDSDSGELLGIIPYPDGIPQVLHFSRDGGYLLVAGGTHSSQGTASLYDVRNGERLLKVGDELDIVFGADINDQLSRVAMGGPKKMVRIFDTSTGAAVFELKKHTDWVYCVDYSPDGVLVASGDRSGGLHVWEADTGRLYLDLIGHKGAIRGLSWRPDSNVLVSASEDGTVKMWEMSAGKQLKSFNAHGGGVTGVMMAKDGRLVTSGKDRTVKLWKADGSAIATMPAFSEPALEATITHDGTKIVGGDWNGRTLMWLIADPKQVTELAANPPRLQDQVASLSSQITTRNKALVDANTEFSKQQELGEKTQQQANAVTTNLQETKQLMAKLSGEKAAAEKLFADLQSEKVEVDKVLAMKRTQLNDLSAAAKQRTDKLNASRKTLAEAKSRHDTATKEKEALTQSLVSLREEHSQLKADAVARLAKLTDRELEVLAHERVAAEKVAVADAATKQATDAIASIDAQIATHATARKNSEQALKTATERVRLLGETIAAETVKRDANRSELDAKTAQMTETQQQIAKSKDEAEKKKLGEKLAIIQNELEAINATALVLKNSLAAKVGETAEQEKQLAQSRQVIAEADKKTKALGTQREKANSPMPSLASQRQKLVAAHSKQTEELAKLRLEIDAANREKLESVKKLAAQLTQVLNLEQREKELAAVVARQADSQASAITQVAALEKALKETTGSLSTVQAETKTNEAKVADLANRIGAQPVVIQKLAEQLKRHSAETPKLEKQLADLNQRKEAATVAITSAKSAVDVATAELHNGQARLEALQSELKSFQAESARLASELAAAKEVAAGKRTAVQPESEKAAKLTEAMSARDAKVTELSDALKKLQMQLDALTKERAAEQATLNETQSRLKELDSAATEAETVADTAKERLEFFESAYGGSEETP
ncbi:MAG: c-type cytochrome domain-containing protein [Rubripirellula sp.]